MRERILKFEHIDWKKLVDFQPKEFKARTKGDIEKLKKSFLQEGNLSCFYVWDDKGTLYTVDGHSRLNVFRLLETEEIELPKTVPCVFIECKNKTEAKRALALYNSKYGIIKEKQFFEFFDDISISEMDTFNISGFENAFSFGDIDEDEIKEEELIKDFKKFHLLISSPIENFEKIMSIIDTMKGINGVEIETSTN